MFVISFNICLFIYFSVKYAIQSNDCDVFVNKQSIYLSIYLYIYLPHSGRKKKGNDHQLKKFLIVKQVLLASTLENV